VLSGKVVLITGAAGGLGLAYAIRLAQEGATLVLADRRPFEPPAVELSKDGSRCCLVDADVTNPSAAKEMACTAVTRFGRIDVLINNAALFAHLVRRPFEEIEDAQWREVLDVNVIGVVNCCRAVVPHMKAQGHGKIINIASNAAHKGMPQLLHYVASKGAVISMTRALARELGPANITVNAIAPGYVPHEGLPADPERERAVIAQRALPRAQTQQDLVGVVAFLCSADSDFITGQTIVVDGGEVLS
jgi:NAD(P)-dependent dehydrogenase (short-subunit alcohol dehydrogenase family)